MPDTWLELGGLLLLFIICVIGAGPVPMPMTVTILWLGQFDFPLAVIMTATAGSALGWFLMATPLKRWFDKRPGVAQRIPEAYQQLFLRRPGFWVFFFNAVPFPWEPMRFLAVIHGYNLTRLLIAQTLGRIVRYTLLVSIGASLAQHQAMLWTVMGAFLLLPLVMQAVLKRLHPPVAKRPVHTELENSPG